MDGFGVLQGAQYSWHRKPSGWSGAPCPICGCPTRRLRAQHRALTAEESWQWGTPGAAVLWVKYIKVAFGTDGTIEAL